MAEGELVRAVPGREAEELVTEADAEDGNAAERVAHDLCLCLQWLRVAGPVREDDAVERGQLVGGCRVRADGDGGAGPGEAAHDRALGAVVDDGHVG